ncbi:MAG TPA: arsenate reductase ArsC [Candidatus Krumholzibacteria bacterium]|nr:arsenate reductase ArsC [Candidatus Krumholzibacteria bacterium]
MNPPRKRLLFVCYANACRSQMAEGFARELAFPGLEVESAGLMAAGLFSDTVASMAEVGIDISGQRSKTVAEFDLNTFDRIVTLSDRAFGQLHRRYPELRLEHHPVLDPAGAEGGREERMKIFNLTREDVRGVVLEVLTELVQMPKRA